MDETRDMPIFDPEDESRWRKAYESSYIGMLKQALAQKLREAEGTLSDRGIWMILDRLITREDLLNLAKERGIELTKKDFDAINQSALMLAQDNLDNYPDDDIYELN